MTSVTHPDYRRKLKALSISYQFPLDFLSKLSHFPLNMLMKCRRSKDCARLMISREKKNRRPAVSGSMLASWLLGTISGLVAIAGQCARR